MIVLFISLHVLDMSWQASLLNENLKRKPKKTKDGKTYMNFTYPKFKMGEEVVREIAEPPTYGM